ncbi:DUF2851 family protein [Chitinophaga sp. NPDC101104]|uniref:DUF2851 family protein n=1 Tax=Chitinophaga sp. NPDC101104 TaxID=3390561 RepID=UPI003CFF9F5B
MKPFVDPLCPESLLQFIWLSGRFNTERLATVAGEPLEILHPGQLNRHAGPDFSAARIRIGPLLWAGNVEIHYRTSDWLRHGHQHDRRYDRVILHVVFQHDADTGNIPVLELQPRIPKILLRRYRALMDNADELPCSRLLARVPDSAWEDWLARLAAGRMERKAGVYLGWLKQTGSNWEEVCLRAVAACFGMPVNTDAFRELMAATPWRALSRSRHNALSLEALLFGQAGLLPEDPKEPWPAKLGEEYRFLCRKYGLESMAPHAWHWLRMRPSSFPTMRIACLAALLHKEPHLFSAMLDNESPESLEALLIVQPSAYWDDHYRFGIPSVRTASMGRQAVRHVLINAVAPLLYAYGQYLKSETLQRRALALWQALGAESNRILRAWAREGVEARSAGESQALIELRQQFCDEKKCLDCRIGKGLLGDEHWLSSELGEEAGWDWGDEDAGLEW